MPIEEPHSGGDVTKSTLTESPLLPPAEQVDFDLEFYDRVLLRNGQHVDALRQQVELLAGRGDYARALELDRRLVRLRPNDKIAHYNLACSLSMLGHVQPAVQALELAIELGYQDVAHLEVDSDLDPLRCVSSFWIMLEKHGLC